MPVTTKAQRSAEGEDSGNCVKPRICEFLSKIKKSAKSGDNLNSLLFLPAEPFPLSIVDKEVTNHGLSPQRFITMIRGAVRRIDIAEQRLGFKSSRACHFLNNL